MIFAMADGVDIAEHANHALVDCRSRSAQPPIGIWFPQGCARIGGAALDRDELMDLAQAAAVGVVVAAIYGAPALLAAWRRHRRAERIALLNLVLGWTVFGWIALLVYAVQPRGWLRSR